MWRQWSTILWLTERDKNSRYFHQKASSHRRKNKILKLQNYEGELKEGAQLDKLIIEYFQSMSSTTNQSTNVEFLWLLEGQVSKEMNKETSKDFTMKKVVEDLNQLNPSKALA